MLIKKALKGIKSENPIEYFTEYGRIAISIEFDKGSLKSRIIVLCSILYLGIAEYGSFRSGLDRINSDSRRFSNIIAEHLTNNNISSQDILKMERRLGIPGRLNSIYKKIDYLEKNISTFSHDDVILELNEIKQRISNISEILPQNTKNMFFDEIPDDYKNELPTPDRAKVRNYINRYWIKEEDIEILED